MRIVLKLEAERGILKLPIHYNHIIQGFIYRNINSLIAQRYHEKGFSYGKRGYKLFVFSRLFSKNIRVKDGFIHLSSPVWFKMGSMDSELLESLAIHLLRKERVKLGGNMCRFLSIEVEAPVEVDGYALVKAISPISVHRSLYDAEGRRKTYYFSPWDPEFSELILENLKRKAVAFYGSDVNLPDMENPVILPVKVSSGNQKIVIYKNYVIKGWMGLYELRLPRFYFDIAYSAGLGSRNSLGFGMVDLVKRLKDK